VPIRKFTTEKHAIRADWLEPAWSSAGKPGRVRLAWMDFYRGSQILIFAIVQAVIANHDGNFIPDQGRPAVDHTGSEDWDKRALP
jgi:hypothetical protein